MIEEVVDDKFKFQKYNYITVGSIERNCFTLLPPDKNNTNSSIFLGDTRGILYLVDYDNETNLNNNINKKHVGPSPVVRVKTNPFKSEIKCIESHSNSNSYDRVFFSYGNSTYLTNRLCNPISKIEFDIPDVIQSFIIKENLIWTISSNSILSNYQFGEHTNEIGSFDIESPINGFHITEVYGKASLSSKSSYALLGCSNRTNVVKDCKKIQHSIIHSSTPSIYHINKSNSYDTKENYILVGTTFGQLGLVIMGETEKEAPQLLWEKNLKNTFENYNNGNTDLNYNVSYCMHPNSSYNSSEIIGIKNFDINNDGNKEIIVVSKLGNVDIYSFGNTVMECNLISHYNSEENITGIQIGNFKKQYESEILLSTYNGLIFGLSPEEETFNTINVNTVPKKIIDRTTLQTNIKQLQEQIGRLQSQIKEKREENDKIMLVNSNNQNYLTIKNPYKTSYKYNLIPNENLYNLLIESEFPLEVLVLESDVRVDIVDFLDANENSNLIENNQRSISTKEYQINIIKNNDNGFQSIVRLKGGKNQYVNLRVRTYDGNKSELKCTLIPLNIPKTAYILSIPIKSLPLFQKVNEDGDELEKLVISNYNKLDSKYINKITITGKFTTREINVILNEILPDLPDRINFNKSNNNSGNVININNLNSTSNNTNNKSDVNTKIKYYMMDTFLNTIIDLEIDNGLCVLKSVYLTPLIIIKEQITKITNERGKYVDNQVKCELISIFKILEEINPLIEQNFEIETKYKIIQAMKEIDINSLDVIPKLYQDIILKKELIEKKYKSRNTNLQFMKRTLINLLKTVSKITHVKDFEQKIKQLESIFKNYSIEKMIDLFKEFSKINN